MIDCPLVYGVVFATVIVTMLPVTLLVNPFIIVYNEFLGAHSKLPNPSVSSTYPMAPPVIEIFDTLPN